MSKVQEYIQLTKDFSQRNKYQSVQIDIADTKHDQDFMRYLVSISEKVIPQQLTSFRRESTNLTVEEILDKINVKDSLKAGIKVVHEPIIKINDYELWEGGFIEGFVRVANFKEPDYFLWCYIKMDKLEEILEKFWEKFRFYDYSYYL